MTSNSFESEQLPAPWLGQQPRKLLNQQQITGPVGLDPIRLKLQSDFKANRSRNLLLVQELTRLLAKPGYWQLS